MKVLFYWICFVSIIIATVLMIYKSELNYKYYKLSLPNDYVVAYREFTNQTTEEAIEEWNWNLDDMECDLWIEITN